MFFEFFEIVERMTPVKRVPEGLLNKVCILFFDHQNRVRSMFLVFL